MLSDHKSQFVRNLFDQIRGEQYGLVKFVEKNCVLKSSNSDIDLIVSDETKSRIIRIITTQSTHYYVKLVKAKVLTKVCIFFSDGDYLELDLIERLMRKNFEYLSVKKMLKSIEVDSHGVQYVSEAYNFLYIFLFYIVNGSTIPQRYMSYFKQKKQTNILVFLDLLNEEFNLKFDDIDQLNDAIYENKRKIENIILKRQSLANTILYKIWHLQLVMSRLQRFQIITFSGVDGAGKTTCIESFNKLLSDKYRRNVINLRHRPSFLPILSSFYFGKQNAEFRTTLKKPRLGKNKSTLSSLLRFLYYYFDYILGQYLIFFKYAPRDCVVVYDRYFFDFICDPKRSNIRIHKSITQFFYKFLMKPHLNVFLFETPEIILSRKAELCETDILELTTEYSEFFKKQPKSKARYMTIKNKDLRSTIHQIELAYREYFRND